MIELGGNIFLEGFSELNGGEMIIIKKLVGNYVKEVTEKRGNFEKLNLNLNKSQLGEKNIFHLQAELHAGDRINAEARDGNIFFALDKALKDINNSL
jgi:ribosome-associated translation inhibitor RaiA